MKWRSVRRTETVTSALLAPLTEKGNGCLWTGLRLRSQLPLLTSPCQSDNLLLPRELCMIEDDLQELALFYQGVWGWNWCGQVCLTMLLVLSHLYRNQVCWHPLAWTPPLCGDFHGTILCFLTNKSTGKQAHPESERFSFSAHECALLVCLHCWGLVFHCGSGKSLHGKLEGWFQKQIAFLSSPLEIKVCCCLWMDRSILCLSSGLCFQWPYRISAIFLSGCELVC